MAGAAGEDGVAELDVPGAGSVLTVGSGLAVAIGSGELGRTSAAGCGDGAH